MENTSINFYKAKLHYFNLKFYRKNHSIPHSSTPVVSKTLNFQQFKNNHKKSISDASSSPESKFNDNKVRLTVWNLLANDLTSKQKNPGQNPQIVHLQPDAQPVNYTSGNLTKILNKHKLHKEKYPWKLASKNINEIKVEKIKPTINNHSKAQQQNQKYDQTCKRTGIFAQKHSLSPPKLDKSRFFRQALNKYGKRGSLMEQNTIIKQNDGSIQYTPNLKELIRRQKKSWRSVELNKKWHKISQTEQVQAWTQRSLKEEIGIINFNQQHNKTQMINQRKKSSSNKRKHNKSHNG